MRNKNIIRFNSSLFSSARFYISIIIVVVLSAGIITFGDFSNWQSPVYVLLLVSLTSYLLVTSMYYFELSETELIMKNHVLFWYEKSFLLSDISELSVEKAQKTAIGLRVKTRKGYNKKFEAGGISYSEWRRIIQTFQERGIQIRNLAV